jgi:hypothetical protein
MNRYSKPSETLETTNVQMVLHLHKTREILKTLKIMGFDLDNPQTSLDKAFVS